MNHEATLAAIGAGVLLAASTLAGLVANVLAVEVPLSVVASIATSLFLLLIGFVAWIARQVYEINGTTSATNEMVKAAVGDVTTLEGRVTRLEDQVHELELAKSRNP